MTEAIAAPAAAEVSTPVPSSAREALSSAFDKVGFEHRKDEPKERGEEEDRPLTGRDIADQERLADAESRRETISKHLNSYLEIKQAAGGWNETRELRQTLRHRYPGANLGELFQTFEQYGELLKSSPLEAAEQLRRHYLMNPRHGWDGAFKAKDYGDGTRGSIDRGFDEAADLNELQPYLEKHGTQFKRLLQRVVQLDGALNDDPEGTIARLAAMNGMPITDQQVAEQAQALERQQEYQRVATGIGTIIEHGMLPGLEDEGVQNAVADILESKDFERTGNGPLDLKRALETAKDMLAKEKAAERVAELKAKAGKSLTGAPSTTVRASQTRHPSTREALAAALGGI
jgi:hypothetical protein